MQSLAELSADAVLNSPRNANLSKAPDDILQRLISQALTTRRSALATIVCALKQPQLCALLLVRPPPEVSLQMCASLTARCPCLRELTITHCVSTKQANRALSAAFAFFPGLTQLDLSNNRSLDDEVVKTMMCHCKHLQSLALSGCPSVLGTFCSKLPAGFDSCHSLDVSYSAISDTSIQQLLLSDLPITALACAGCAIGELTETALRHKSIKRLDLDWTPVCKHSEWINSWHRWKPACHGWF